MLRVNSVAMFWTFRIAILTARLARWLGNWLSCNVSRFRSDVPASTHAAAAHSEESLCVSKLCSKAYIKEENFFNNLSNRELSVVPGILAL
uniref:SFRICE_006359 n=1 Tax=Spodoptera frugiperda TaxID=7108 RepID=A0A2H1VAG0_SPOFR